MEIRHLSGLKEKIAARDFGRRTKKCLHYGTFPVPANHVRSTRRERQTAHAERMAERRQHQLARTPGFVAVGSKAR